MIIFTKHLQMFGRSTGPLAEQTQTGALMTMTTVSLEEMVPSLPTRAHFNRRFFCVCSRARLSSGAVPPLLPSAEIIRYPMRRPPPRVAAPQIASLRTGGNSRLPVEASPGPSTCLFSWVEAARPHLFDWRRAALAWALRCSRLYGGADSWRPQSEMLVHLLILLFLCRLPMGWRGERAGRCVLGLQVCSWASLGETAQSGMRAAAEPPKATSAPFCKPADVC